MVRKPVNDHSVGVEYDQDVAAALVDILLQLGEFVDEACVRLFLDIDLRIADFFHVGFFIPKCCFVYSSGNRSWYLYTLSLSAAFLLQKFISFFKPYFVLLIDVTDAYGQVRVHTTAM